MLTASDIPAVLGVDAHRGALAVYLAKVGDIETVETAPMVRGRRFEGVIGEEYGAQTGRPVASVGEYEIQQHPDLPWIGATLDRVTRGSGTPSPLGTDDDTEAPLQIKLALGTAGAWKEGPPLAFLVQVQIEIACYRARWGALAGLIGPGPLHVSDHVRDDAFLRAALPGLEEFWGRVQRREPPPADGLDGTTAAIKRMWADEDGETVTLDQSALDLWSQLEAAKDEIRDAKAREDAIHNELRVRLGSASFGRLSDGSYLTLKTTHRAGFTVQPTTYRTLRRWRPKLHRRK